MAGIYNPYPIRFRGQKSAVQFNCATTLSPLVAPEGRCQDQREKCVWNEYTRETNEPTTTSTEMPKKKKRKGN